MDTFGVFLLALAILGALRNNTGFALAAALMSIPYGLLLAGVVAAVVSAAALMSEAILIGKVNTAYKKYVTDNSF